MAVSGVGSREWESEAMMAEGQADVDRLNAIGVLTRREIEARILAPVIDALGQRFGRDAVVAIVRDVIVTLAREQGRAMAEARQDTSLQGFAGTLEPWTRDGALELDVREHSDERLSFDVTRCRYAEMYRTLGIPELGAVLSCNRDAALIEGFNTDVTLVRTQTIMQGAPCCDFRYSTNTRQPEGHEEQARPPSPADHEIDQEI
jgi:L-2-amino-thiazoline-4-carboxylic acid hydrolase